MSVLPTLFLDDGGVMNDNRVRSEQWATLLGEYFSERAGGEPERWAEANRRVFQGAFDSLVERLPTCDSNAEFEAAYADAWVLAMFEGVGLEPPPAGASRLGHYREAGRLVPPRIRSAFAGAVEAIRLLWDSGYALHTASGETSVELDGYLRGMGVRECFGGLYGTDIVDIPKAGPEYYRRVFEHAGVEPANALVFDDRPEACAWAEATGARTVLVDHSVDAMSLAAIARRLLG